MKAPWSDFCFRARSFFPELGWTAGRSRENRIRPTGCEPCAGGPWRLGGKAEEEEEQERWGPPREREDGEAETEDTGDAPVCPAARAAIPPANLQILGFPEVEGVEGVEGGASEVTDKLASFTSVLAVS